MNTLQKFLCVVNLLFFFIISVYCENGQPRLEPSAYIEKYEERLDNPRLGDLIDLALYFSGVTGEELAGYQEKFAGIITEVKDHMAELEPSPILAEKILKYSHTKWLKSYQEKETRMDVLLDKGIFNCVSSSVLYMILSTALGMPAWGVRTIDHAFCRVAAGDLDYDVETTNIYGFDPGTKKEFRDDFGNITGFNYVPPGNYSDRRDIDPVHLLGLILQNRITFLSEKRNFTDAVGLAVDYWELLGDTEAYKIVTNAFINMWSTFNSAGAFQEGIIFYDSVIDRFGADQQLLQSRSNLTHNYLLTLIESDQLESAKKVLDERSTAGALEESDINKFNIFIIIKQVQTMAEDSYADAIIMIKQAVAAYGEDDDLIRLKNNYVHNIIVDLIQGNQLETARAYADQYKAGGDLKSADWKELMVTIIQKQAYVFKDDYLKAARIIRAGIEEIGQETSLLQYYNTYLHNYEVTVHNQMVHLYNAGEYAEARILLEAALVELPDSQRLQGDLEKVLGKMD